MAQLWTTGPAHFYVNSPTASLAVASYLGTCAEPPDIDKRPAWEPVFNQLGGTKIPFDQSFEGEDALIDANINRFNMAPLLALEDYVRTAGALTGGTAVPGTSVPGDIGTLMLTENACHALLVVFPYSTKLVYAGQVPGYLFPAVVLEGNTLRKAGTIVREARLVWHALRALSMAVTNTFGTGSLQCYRALTAAEVLTLPAVN